MDHQKCISTPQELYNNVACDICQKHTYMDKVFPSLHLLQWLDRIKKQNYEREIIKTHNPY